MRDFTCPQCGQHLAFENSMCLSCGSRLAFSLTQGTLVIVADAEARQRAGVNSTLCANVHIAGCNWLAELNSSNTFDHGLCASCRLTRTRPNDGDTVGMEQFASAERAKRRLLAELTELALPIVGRDEDPGFGLAFDLLSSGHQEVITGHQNGVITIDLAEVDNAHREQLRIAMGEPYRTLLGHLRHETGHAYFHRLVGASARRLAEFHELFGDPDADYQAALHRNYNGGAEAAWAEQYVSSYAAMHAAEDWAETFAHYLHIRDTLDTAAAFGLVSAAGKIDRRVSAPVSFDTIIDIWLPLAWSLNMVNRSMGRDDLYPFVLPAPVLEKMHFIHTVVSEPTRPRRDSRLSTPPCGVSPSLPTGP